MGAKMETDMRRDLFAHLQTLSYSYYTDTKVGQIMARITSDLFDITEFAHHCPEEIIITGIKIGDANKTLTGRHTYTIRYTYNIGKDPLKNADELYFNLIGEEWDTTIDNISFNIKMPKILVYFHAL